MKLKESKVIAVQNFPTSLWAKFGAELRVRGFTLRDGLIRVILHLLTNPKTLDQVLKTPTSPAST